MDAVDVAGLRITYERAGSGPPLLILPGAFDDHRWWRQQLDGLSDEFTVVVWEAPGVGGSSEVPEDFELADFADCVAGFVAALRLERPHVLGLSFGGGLAIEVYHRHPTLPRSLVLAGAYAGWGGSLPPEEIKKRLALGERMVEMTSKEVIDAWLPTFVHDDTPPEVVAKIRLLLSEIRTSAAPTTARAFARADLRDVLPTIAIPTLVLHGENDVRAPFSVAEALHTNIPDSKLVVLPGGHLTNLENPKRFNTDVRAFLRGVT
jgi:pimeloyl-ACP methyl ester carboxylesterase